MNLTQFKKKNPEYQNDEVDKFLKLIEWTFLSIICLSVFFVVVLFWADYKGVAIPTDSPVNPWIGKGSSGINFLLIFFSLAVISVSRWIRSSRFQ